ncbi:MAG: hypothetical protein M3112_04460 [Actinomycetia bacterium]|nr:hypothetical protein [Actinomycetes bacterium]
MFRGTGTINGIGEYRLVIWDGDGEPDTFGIKIWREDSGVETVIYDNGSARGAISGGSIIIHTAKKQPKIRPNQDAPPLAVGRLGWVAPMEPMSPYRVHTARGWDGRGINAKR